MWATCSSDITGARALIRALLVVIPATFAASAIAENPKGWDACNGLNADPGIWQSCADAASRDCILVREAEGDQPWATCLHERAEEWEKALVQQSTALRERGNPAGDSGALARWMATRAVSCHRQSEIDQMVSELGETAAAAAVFQCELASNIQEASRLRAIADAK